MLKRVAAIGSSTAVIGALLTGALSAPALSADSAACPTATGSLNGSGTAADPYLITNRSDLQEYKEKTAADYWATGVYAELTADIDMRNPSQTRCVWDTTIGNDTSSALNFMGNFDGNGFTISGLDVVKSDEAGLFGETEGASISNVGFEGDVTGDGNVGGLVGYAGGDTRLNNVWATGDVTGGSDVGGLVGEVAGSDSTVANSWASGDVTSTSADVGGLIGIAEGSVTASYATGDVTGAGDDVGGLIGEIDGSEVRGSWATGDVTNSSDFGAGLVAEANSTDVVNSWASGNVNISTSNNYAGGLIANTSGSVINSYAIGNINAANDYVGGLIGQVDPGGEVVGSYATGKLTANDDYVGGLVGEFNGVSILQSWASGAVTSGGSEIGGLVGQLTAGEIARSYGIGAVTSANGDYVGGLVGQTVTGTFIRNTFATGAATATTGEDVGGLVGDHAGTVENSYSTGVVTGDGDGGLVGTNNGTVTSSYWDTETSGLSLSDGGTGKTTVEMREITTFVGWSISEGYNPASTWGICGPVNSGYPYLTAFNSSDPCVTPPTSYQFTFRLPDGTECGAIGPVGVIDGTIYILPGEDADCRTMDGALVGGWTIPVPDGYDSIGSPAMPFAPGQKVRVSDSQQFTVVPFEPLLSLTLDSNVMVDEACEANEVEFVDEANRVEYSWVPRSEISMARLPVVGACQPPGYTLAGWNTASDGSGAMLAPGAGLPSDWATDKTNRYRLFAIWSRS